MSVGSRLTAGDACSEIFAPAVTLDPTPRTTIASADTAIRIRIASPQPGNRPGRELLREYLAGHGYRVESAPGGAEALGLCVHEGFRPAMLIMDVVMPGIGGRALADRLRKRDPNLKVLFLSGYTDEAMLRHGILPSGTQFMQKPFALQALARTVRRVLDEPGSQTQVA